MGYQAKRTEHSGPKRGNGAHWAFALFDERSADPRTIAAIIKLGAN